MDDIPFSEAIRSVTHVLERTRKASASKCAPCLSRTVDAWNESIEKESGKRKRRYNQAKADKGDKILGHCVGCNVPFSNLRNSNASQQKATNILYSHGSKHQDDR